MERNLNDVKLRLGETSFGRAVFAAVQFPPGAEVVELRGRVVERDQLPSPYGEVEDRFLQIGPSKYIGPSGGFDDYVNHSCDPNSGLKFLGRRIVLSAIRDIAPGEEITFDYSTTMDENDWELECRCGSALCRGVIRDYKTLPDALKKRYRELGIVPAYLLRA